jgi:hypothetical protein
MESEIFVRNSSVIDGLITIDLPDDTEVYPLILKAMCRVLGLALETKDSSNLEYSQDELRTFCNLLENMIPNDFTGCLETRETYDEREKKYGKVCYKNGIAFSPKAAKEAINS